jgi:hypothetical protein
MPKKAIRVMVTENRTIKTEKVMETDHRDLTVRKKGGRRAARCTVQGLTRHRQKVEATKTSEEKDPE